MSDLTEFERAALKAEVAATPVQKPVRGLEALAADQPGLKARVEQLIEANSGLRGEPMREDEGELA